VTDIDADSIAQAEYPKVGGAHPHPKQTAEPSLKRLPWCPSADRRKAHCKMGKAIFLCLAPDCSLRYAHRCPLWCWGSIPMRRSLQTLSVSQLFLNLIGGKHGLEAAFPSAMALLSQIA